MELAWNHSVMNLLDDVNHSHEYLPCVCASNFQKMFAKSVQGIACHCSTRLPKQIGLRYVPCFQFDNIIKFLEDQSPS